jgi:protoporphyrin/coproporphyrin ferrochelatase
MATRRSGDEIEALKDAGCDRILLAPLYPQYSGATTATAMDALGGAGRHALAGGDPHPAALLRRSAAYRSAAAKADTARQLKALDFVPEVLLLSFHGMPERTLHLGDPYHCQCRKTARLLGEALAGEFPAFGSKPLSSRASAAPSGLSRRPTTCSPPKAAKGTKRLAIAAPGFSADCLETLEELAIRGREQFEEAGGTHFAALSCLNTSPAGMDMIEALVRRELQGWID